MTVTLHKNWRFCGDETDKHYRDWFADENATADNFRVAFYHMLQVGSKVITPRATGLPDYEDTIIDLWLKFIPIEENRRRRYLDARKAGTSEEDAKLQVNFKVCWGRYIQKPIKVAMNTILGRSKIKQRQADDMLVFQEEIVQSSNSTLARQKLRDSGEMQVYHAIRSFEQTVGVEKERLLYFGGTKQNILANLSWP